MTDIARYLIAAAYPISHDEGCYLDPYYGEENFHGYIDNELANNEHFEPDSVEPFCNCGTDDLNDMAAGYLRNE